MAQKKPIDAKEIKVAGLDKVRPEAYSEGAELNKSGFPFRYFRLRTVCEITGLSKTTVYEYSKTDPEFPKEALQKPSLILRSESFCLLHRLNFCANDCSGYF